MDENQEIREYGLKDESFYIPNEEFNEKREQRKKEVLNKRKREKRRRKIVLGLILLVGGLFAFSFSNFFVVDSIEVIGNSYFTAEEIINMAHAEPGKNLLYHPDKASIIGYLENNPYIKNAKVSRGLPSTLVITVEEREQLSAIKYDNDYLIIDKTGFLLRKTRSTPKVTALEGIVVKKIKVGEEIGVEDEELFEQTLDILTTMQEKDLYFVRLDMSGMYVKAYIYEGLVCKGTYTQLIDGMNKDRLHKIIERLFSDGIKRGTITFSDEGYASFIPII